MGIDLNLWFELNPPVACPWCGLPGRVKRDLSDGEEIIRWECSACKMRFLLHPVGPRQ